MCLWGGRLGDSWFPTDPAIKTAFPPSGAYSVCGGESFLMPQLNFFPAVGHGNSSAQDSRRQQKCVVSKCTWHFSSTTQLLSELATCALERRGAWGAPKVLSLEFANTSRDDGKPLFDVLQKNQSGTCQLLSLPSRVGNRAWILALSLQDLGGGVRDGSGRPAGICPSLHLCAQLWIPCLRFPKSTVIITSL